MSKKTKTPLDPLTIPKYHNRLIKQPAFEPVKEEAGGEHGTPHYEVDISRFEQQMLPEGFPKTTVWGYGGMIRKERSGRLVYYRSAPGPTFDVKRGEKIRVRWVNNLHGSHLFAVDPTVGWANPNRMPAEPPQPWPAFPPGFDKAQWPVPVVTHLHGGENPPQYDGNPEAWFTSNGQSGRAFKTNDYVYGNAQQAATLWYHDHALGMTRLNVYAGLSGFYIIRDGYCHAESADVLPKGKYEVPIVIQDKSFNTDGSFAFPVAGDNPGTHPYWRPEFFGDTIAVNGSVWPNLDVDHRMYRLRLLNGSSARFYNLYLSNYMAFYQIGTDGGYLGRPVELHSLLMAPGERADLLVDFSACEPDQKILLLNDAAAPYPNGDAADPDTVGQIMQFNVLDTQPERPSLPYILNRLPQLHADLSPRILTLNEVQGENGPVVMLLNGQMYDAPVTETPLVSSTGDWAFVNLTKDAHPIHLHLVQFQIVSRQSFNAPAYSEKWAGLNGSTLPLDHETVSLPTGRYVTGPVISPEENERGWKDTVKCYPGQITTIRVRFAPQDLPVNSAIPGVNVYPFDPGADPGYVWHCHILDHEDNEMMRPMKIGMFC